MSDISTLITDEIINYLLIASVVAVVLTPLVLVIIKVARIKAPVYRHMLWLCILICIVALPAIGLHGPKLTFEVLPAKGQPAEAITPEGYYSDDVELARNAPAEIRSPRLISAETTVMDHANPSRLFLVKAVLTGLWLVGIIFMLTRLFVGWFRLRRICLAAEPVSGNGRFENMYGGRSKVLLTSKVDRPVCFGLLQPVIILPREIYNNAAPEDLQMVLSHELAHIQRWDCWTNLLQRVIEAIFFFHPLVWYASSQLTQQREQICDNYVIEKGAPIMDYTKLLSRIAGQGLEKTRFQAVALFEGRLVQRIRSLLDPKHNTQTKTSCRAAVACAIAVLICLGFGTLRLEAKSGVDTLVGSDQTEQTGTGDVADTESIDPAIRELGEAVRKRLTTYSDKEILTLEDGQTGRMKVKENITPVAEILITPRILADGTKFDLEGFDATGKAIEGTKTTSPVIHDAQSMRMGLGKHFFVNGKQIMSKIQLVPTRQDDNSIVVEVKALFTEVPDPQEREAMLLAMGQKGQLFIDFRDIILSILQYKQKNGSYPENLQQLNETLPKDIYSPSEEDYHYEHNQTRLILSSCGEDGFYGTDDDEIYINSGNRTRSGQRHELYPLEEDEQEGRQIETLGPSGRRPSGNCSLGGRVVSETTGEPIAHAKVYLFCTETHDAIFIDVASNGTFMFENIPTGPFSLRTTNTAGFQDVVYNPDNKPGGYKWFSLEDGERRTDLVLKAKPAYSISGIVLDESGEPLRDQKLWVWAWAELDELGGNLNRYRIVEQKLVASDGSYFLDGLDGQPVYIMAIDLKAEEKDESYPPCYYPGTVARNEAHKVYFAEENAVVGIDIRLKKKGRFVLEGVVTDETTSDVIPKTLVTVHHRDMLFDRILTYTDEQGHYRIESLGTGEFLVHVDAEPWGFVRTRKPVLIERAQEINQLNFTLRPGVTISGEFVDENGDPIEISPQAYGLAYRDGYPNPETMSWSGSRNKYGIKGSSGNNTFNGGEGDYEEEYMDFPTPSTFIIEGIIPGKTVFRFHPKTEGQIVRDILHNGQSILDTGIETMPGQEIKDVIIMIGTQ
ncbi:MAG: M56 family metallopeptidase [Planctomycetota bacterium]|jgi:beta-lactamase regulating signal transducer with metallopeptidase domain